MPIHDALLTILIVATLCWVAVWKSSPRKGLFSFDKNLTNYLKGFCALVVVFTHIPDAFGNPIQKAVHCFGFVAVTLFFLISAFGMSASAARTPEGYLSHFWRNRLASLLVPCLLVNVCGMFCALFLGQMNLGQLACKLIQLPRYVLLLLQYCLLFYVVMQILVRAKLPPWIGYTVLCFGVIVSSLFSHFVRTGESGFSAWNGWPCERWGLVWGLLLFLFFGRFAAGMDIHRRAKTIAAGMLAGILGITYLSFKTVAFFGDYLLRVALGLVIIIFIFLLAQNRNLGNVITGWLGGISYEIYLSHGLAMSIANHYFPSLSSGFFIALSLGITLAISLGIHTIASRIVSKLRIPSVQ